MALPAASYHPRRPQDSDYYQCVDIYFATFVQSQDDHFSKQYGFWRPYIEKLIYRYLDCGDLQNVSRGKRKEAGTDDATPCILDPVENSKAFRNNRARL